MADPFRDINGGDFPGLTDSIPAPTQQSRAQAWASLRPYVKDLERLATHGPSSPADCAIIAKALRIVHAEALLRQAGHVP